MDLHSLAPLPVKLITGFFFFFFYLNKHIFYQQFLHCSNVELEPCSWDVGWEWIISTAWALLLFQLPTFEEFCSWVSFVIWTTTVMASYVPQLHFEEWWNDLKKMCVRCEACVWERKRKRRGGVVEWESGAEWLRMPVEERQGSDAVN